MNFWYQTGSHHHPVRPLNKYPKWRTIIRALKLTAALGSLLSLYTKKYMESNHPPVRNSITINFNYHIIIDFREHPDSTIDHDLKRQILKFIAPKYLFSQLLQERMTPIQTSIH